MGQIGQSPYPFEVLVAFFWMAVFLIIGTVMRAKIPLMRRWLVPACMSGGVVGAILINLGCFDMLGPLKPNAQVMSAVVFHLFALSFCCFGLSGFGNSAGSTPLRIIKVTFWFLFIMGGVGYLQTAMGMSVIYGWNSIFGTNIYESVGVLLNRGFSQGPGAALSVGAVWEQAGWSGMVPLGLAFAAMGYVAAVIAGVPLTSWLMRKTKMVVDGEIPENELKGVYEVDCGPSGGCLTFISSNIDTFSFQAALLFLTYGLAYGVITLLGFVLSPGIMGMAWSLFAFFFCLPVGIVISEVLMKRVFKIGHLHSQDMHSRLLGFIVDFMAVGALLAVEITAIGNYLAIMLVLSVLCTILTGSVLWFGCRKLKEYAPHRFMAMFGNATGTVTSGLVLVRMMDPEFRTPVPFELGLVGACGMVMLPITMAVIPLEFGQALGTTPWWYALFATLGIGTLFISISLLPIWGLRGKDVKF